VCMDNDLETRGDYACRSRPEVVYAALGSFDTDSPPASGAVFWRIRAKWRTKTAPPQELPEKPLFGAFCAPQSEKRFASDWCASKSSEK
jgi:hypothetical protein